MSKNFQFSEEENDHKYFSILQNILSHIGLTAFERSLYWAIKECAGEKGKCTKSYHTLAKVSGMSTASVKRTLKSLSQKNEALKKPLIKVQKRLTQHGDWDTHEITLTSLWGLNIKFFQEISGEVTQTSPGVTQTRGVRSHRPEGEVTQTYKEEPFNKINGVASSRPRRICNLSEIYETTRRSLESMNYPLTKSITNPRGEATTASLQEFITYCINLKLDYTTEEIEESWVYLCDYKSEISHYINFLSYRIDKKRQTSKIKTKKEKISCLKQQRQEHLKKSNRNKFKDKSSLTNYNTNTSENDLSGQVLQDLASQHMQSRRFPSS